MIKEALRSVKVGGTPRQVPDSRITSSSNLEGKHKLVLWSLPPIACCASTTVSTFHNFTRDSSKVTILSTGFLASYTFTTVTNTRRPAATRIIADCRDSTKRPIMPSAGGSGAGARPSTLLPNKRTTPKGTPLAPSVEKAYYRKCIQLKRRLNEVEAANEEARIRRGRLDRAIMKMRLERAFLLEQLQRRMEVSGQIEASDGSGSEGVGTVSA